MRRSTRIAPFALDLHVLGTPPAFVLSQDQTLQLNSGVLNWHPPELAGSPAVCCSGNPTTLTRDTRTLLELTAGSAVFLGFAIWFSKSELKPRGSMRGALHILDFGWPCQQPGAESSSPSDSGLSTEGPAPTPRPTPPARCCCPSLRGGALSRDLRAQCQPPICGPVSGLSSPSKH